MSLRFFGAQPIPGVGASGVATTFAVFHRSAHLGSGRSAGSELAVRTLSPVDDSTSGLAGWSSNGRGPDNPEHPSISSMEIHRQVYLDQEKWVSWLDYPTLHLGIFRQDIHWMVLVCPGIFFRVDHIFGKI